MSEAISGAFRFNAAQIPGVAEFIIGRAFARPVGSPGLRATMAAGHFPSRKIDIVCGSIGDSGFGRISWIEVMVCVALWCGLPCLLRHLR